MRASISIALGLMACANDPSPTRADAGAGSSDPLRACGDGTCQVGETLDTCPADCSTCGDGMCTGPETLANCTGDCSMCGDGMCTGGETAATCDDDCTVCGDHACTGGETNADCPGDCAAGLTIANASSYTVYYLYWWKCDATNTFVNQLPGSLPPSYHVDFTGLAAGCYDLEATTSGNTHAWSQSQTMLVAGATYTWTLTN